MGVLSNADALANIGFSCDVPSGVDETTYKAASLALDDSWARQLGNQCVRLLFFRFERLTWHTHRVPGLLAGLSGTISAVVPKLRQLRAAAQLMSTR